MIVVDTSAFLETLLRTQAADVVDAHLSTPGRTLHAPHLLDIEVAQVIRRYTLSGQIDAAQAAAALSDFLAFPLRRYSHDVLLPRVWELRSNLTAYDAVYVALAEALDAPLLTRDRRLAAAARKHVAVELV